MIIRSSHSRYAESSRIRAQQLIEAIRIRKLPHRLQCQVVRWMLGESLQPDHIAPPVGSLTLTKQTRQLRKRRAKEKPRKNSRFQMNG